MRHVLPQSVRRGASASQGRLLCTCLCGIALGAGHGVACAAGFQLFEQNASGLGNAYAGQVARADDASAIYFNPAGLAYIPGRQLVGSLDLLKTSSEFNNTASCPPFAGAGVGTTACPAPAIALLGHPPGNDGGNAGDWGAVPSFYLSWEAVPKQVWLGIGLNAPFGLKTEWDDGWIGRFHAVESEVKTVNINPTVAWKINEMVSVGGGFSAQWLDTTLSNAVSYRAVALASGVGPLIAATPLGAEGLATVKGDDWGWGWNIGMMFNLQPATRLGISYRSTIKYDVEGDVRFDNRPAAMGAVPQVANGDVKARIKLPDTWSVGVSHQLNPKVELLADYTWTGWDSIQDLVIKRSSGPLSGQTLTSTSLHFENTWRIGIGGNYLLNDVWKLRAGFAYDNGNTSDEFRTPRLPDSDRLWFALGAQWTLAPNTVLDFGYVYIHVKDVDSRLPNQETATTAPRGSLVGNYDADVHVLGAQVRWGF